MKPLIENSFYSEVYVALCSLHIQNQVRFYSELLQTAPLLSTPTYAEFRLSGLRLAIFVPKAGNESEFRALTGGSMSLCLEVSDIECAIARLKTLGYPPPAGIMNSFHGQEIYAYDPDGNRLILHQSPEV